MKNFQMVSIKRLKKMGKEDAYDTVIQELPDLVSYYFRFGTTKKEVADAIFERMKDWKNYARYIAHGLEEEENPFPEGFPFMLADFIRRFSADAMNDDEIEKVCSKYTKVMDKICKRRAKAIASDLDMPKDLALELAIIYPGDIINKHNAWVFSKELNRKILALQKITCPKIEVKEDEAAAKKTTAAKKTEKKEEESNSSESKPLFTAFDFSDKKFLKKLYKKYFGGDIETLERVYANILLEREVPSLTPEQKLLNDAITSLVLRSIEKLPLKTVSNLGKYYMARRDRDQKRGIDCKRRILVSNLNYEESPKLVTVFNPDKYSFKDALKKEKSSKKKDKKKGKKKKGGKKGKKK